MFCFKAGVFRRIKEISTRCFEGSKKALEKNNKKIPLEESMLIPSISVDYAVMEKLKIKAVKAHFKWSDMGSFESVYEYLKSKGHPVDKMEIW